MGLRALIGTLGIDISGWRQGWAKAEGVSKKAASSIGAFTKGQLAGMFGAGAILSAMKNTIDYAARINDLSSELGISRDRIQELGYAAEQNGAKFEDFQGVLRRLASARQRALDDANGKEARGFKKLSVAVSDLKSMRLDDLLLKVSDAYGKISNPQEVMAEAIAVLGRQSPKVFQALREDLRGTMKAAHEMNQVMSDETITSLEALGDQIAILGGVIRTELGEAMALALTNIMTTINWALKHLGIMATYAGARKGGASKEEAYRMAHEYEKWVDDRGAAAVADREKRKANRLKEGMFAPVFASNKDDKSEGMRTSDYKSTATSWQQIGAFAFLNPMLSAQNKTNTFLQNIDKNTKKKAGGNSGGFIEDDAF